MFVYIDEAGNTGKNNADEKQKWFYHMALASKYNLDFDTSLNEIKKKHSIDELHGVENSGLIESISPSLLKLLRKNCVDFCITVIEKSFLAYSKLYDTLFDNIENIGARAQFYQLRSLRLMLLCDLIQVLPENVAQKFYMECRQVRGGSARGNGSVYSHQLCHYSRNERYYPFWNGKIQLAYDVSHVAV